MTDPTSTASGIAALAQRSGKPLLTSWMGGEDVEAGRDVLRRAGVAMFAFPDEAARAFHGMWRHSANIAALYETVTIPSEVAAADARRGAAHVLASARQRGETLLSESASKQLLELYGIPCVPTFVAAAEDEARAIADRVGYPVALKIHSTTITHKAASGGVRLNLRDAAAVRNAFGEIKDSATALAGGGSFQGVSVQPMVSGDGCELIVGSSVDPQFGPVMLFGFGGGLVEAVKDQALALPPLNVPLARRLIERTRIGRALASSNARNRVDLTRLEQLIVRFSQLVVEQRSIREIEINPLFASHDRLVALDARVTLYPAHVPESQLPRPAIRPYPAHYTWTMNTRDGRTLLVRPIRPSDEQRIVRFHQALSDRTVHCRYGGIMNLAARTAHERLIRSCFVDFDRQIALVVVASEPPAEDIVGVARLLRQPGSAEAEFAIVVADAWQRRGVGTQLLKQLITVAKAEGLRSLTATIVPENEQMIGLCRRLGFTLVRQDPSDGSEDWTAEMQLGA
jgi:acetyltransferase